MPNIIQSVLSRVLGIRSIQKSGNQIFSLTWNMWVNEVWPDIDKRLSIEEGYADNTALFSIVNHDAEKFASIPRYIYNADSKISDRVYDKRLIDGNGVKDLARLLRRPNKNQSQSEFYELLRVFYKSTGDGIIWLNRGDVADEFTAYDAPRVDANGQMQYGTFRKRTDDEIARLPILEMFVLPSGFVGAVPDPTDMFGVAAYWLDVNGRKIPLRKCDVIHWKRQNPVFDPATASHLMGLNPFHVGRRTIQENKDAVAATDRMFKNDGAKGVLVNENLKWDALSEKQKQDLKDLIDSRVNNAAEVKGAIATLGGKWNYLNIAKDSVDKSLLDGKKMTWQELCFLLSVPFELFDTQTTYANKEQAQKGWVSNTIAPACLNIDDKMTEALALSFGLVDTDSYPTVVISSDFSALPEMRKDVAALITAFQNAWYIPPNRKLTELGYDPIKDKIFDEPWLPDGVKPLSDIKQTMEFANQSQQELLNGINDNPINTGVDRGASNSGK